MKIIRKLVVILLGMVILLTFAQAPVLAEEKNNAYQPSAYKYEGNANAVLTANGELIFFRSRYDYANGSAGTFSDIYGNTYNGTVYTDIETHMGGSPWNDKRESVKSVSVAEGQGIKPISTAYWFFDCNNLETVDLINMDTSGVTRMEMIFMFAYCSKLKQLDLSSFDTGKITCFDSMFKNCYNLHILDISSFDTSKAVSMLFMFAGCENLYSVKLGPEFTVWRDDSYLPKGKWFDNAGNMILSETELYSKYPANAASWAGSWTKYGITFSDAAYEIPAGSTADISAAVHLGPGQYKFSLNSGNDNIAAGDIVQRIGPASHTMGLKCLVSGRKVGVTILTATAKGLDTGYGSTVIRVVFTDVPYKGVYYSEPVYWAVEQGITNGYSDADGIARTFKPQNTCTREAVVTFLWRMAGKPEPGTKKSPFKDVQDPAKYYYKAVLWAAEKGITGGYSDGTFRPDATCLREHVVTFIWRYAGKPEPASGRNPFNDVKSSDYYYKAALWANSRGIAKGYSSGEHAGGFGPKLDCLREHVVTFLRRYYLSVHGAPAVD